MFYKALLFRTRHEVPFESPQRQALDLHNYCLFGMRILKAGIYLQNDQGITDRKFRQPVGYLSPYMPQHNRA